MATWQYRNKSTGTFDITSTEMVMSSSTVNVWLSLYTILQTYIAPVLIVNALAGNSFIILLTLTPNAFSKQTSFTVCAFYVSFAIADLTTVIVANLFSWIGVPGFCYLCMRIARRILLFTTIILVFETIIFITVDFFIHIFILKVWKKLKTTY